MPKTKPIEREAQDYPNTVPTSATAAELAAEIAHIEARIAAACNVRQEDAARLRLLRRELLYRRTAEAAPVN